MNVEHQHSRHINEHHTTSTSTTPPPSLSHTPHNHLRFLGSLEAHKGWVTAIATSSENPDMILTAS
jgi:hypothetical protein